jgi:hypothetical protein
LIPTVRRASSDPAICDSTAARRLRQIALGVSRQSGFVVGHASVSSLGTRQQYYRLQRTSQPLERDVDQNPTLPTDWPVIH